MSRIGKAPVSIPAKVKVAISGNKVSAEGPKGKLDLSLPRLTVAEVKGNEVVVTRTSEVAEARAIKKLKTQMRK